MKSLVAAAAAVIALSFVCLAGCSSSTDDAADEKSSAQEGELKKRRNQSNAAKPVVPKDAERLTAWTGGGGFFSPEPPEGSTCRQGAVRYEIVPAKSELTSHVCIADREGAPFHPAVKTKTLTSEQVKKLNESLAEVKRSTLDICGADKPFLELSVASPSQGLQTFTDSFYACMGGDRVYVDNIDELFQTLEDLSTALADPGNAG
jgi:hypothetical protein